MEAAKIIKRIASYLLFVIAATLFFYQMVILSTSMYIDPGEDFTAYLISDVFRPFMYALVCFGVMLVSQFALIGKDSNKYINSLMLIVLFGVGLFVSVFILVKGILAIPTNDFCQDPTFLYLTVIPLIGICFLEVLFGAIIYFLDKKDRMKQKEQENEKNLEQDGVKLTKE